MPGIEDKFSLRCSTGHRRQNRGILRENNPGLLAELADAMDSKSISQKEYRFDSDRGQSFKVRL